MKKFLVLIPALIFAISLQAQPPQIDAVAGMQFGEKITADNAVKANDLAKTLADKKDAVIKVEGKVLEVCKAEGCWLRMQTPEGTMLIKMKNHGFLVPLSLNGKTVVAEGTATLKETSVAMLKHYAEDAGKTAEEIAAITEPKKELVMQASGILVL